MQRWWPSRQMRAFRCACHASSSPAQAEMCSLDTHQSGCPVFLQEPTKSHLLPGRWRLLYTSKPGTASPIQTTFTGVDAFSVFQEVLDLEQGVRVNNIVDFGPRIGQLKVDISGSTKTFFRRACHRAARSGQSWIQGD